MKILLVSVLVLCLSSVAQAYNTWPIENSNFVCITDFELTQLGKLKNGTVVILPFERKLKKLDRRLYKIEEKMDRFINMGAWGQFNKLEKKYMRLLDRYDSMLDCYYAEGGGGSPNPPTPNPTPAPGPNPTPNPGDPTPPSNSACSAYTDAGAKDLSGRIIGGDHCSGNSPVVQLHMDGQFACSGTLVTSRFVVTAAHCFGDNPNSVKVVSTSGSANAASFHVHPNYGNNEDHDVAVVVLSTSLSGPTMSIRTPDVAQIGTTSAIAGYGEDQNGNYGSLKAGYLVIGQLGADSIVGYYNGYNKGQDANTCYGDSGGPLAVQLNGVWYLAGVTSSGSNNSCGVDGNVDHSTFARVGSASNVSFIKQYMP